MYVWYVEEHPSLRRMLGSTPPLDKETVRMLLERFNQL